MRGVRTAGRVRAVTAALGMVFGVGLGLASLPGCISPIGTTARSFLAKARTSENPNIRHLAYEKLADPACYTDERDRGEAVELLCTRLSEGKEPVISRAVICRTLGQIRDPASLPALRNACDDPEPVIRAAACRAIGAFGQPEDTALLARIMAADTDADCRIAAIEGLGASKGADPRALEVLADGMAHTDPAIRLSSYEALKTMTGRDLGAEAQPWKDLVSSQPPPAASEPEAIRVSGPDQE